MDGHGIRHGSLVHLDLAHVVDDDFELTESTIVDHARLSNLRAAPDVMRLIHVVEGLTVPRIPQEFHGVRDDRFVRVDSPSLFVFRSYLST